MSIVSKASNPELYNALFPEDEIKEKIKAYYMNNDIDEVLDYITNLQEDLEKVSGSHFEIFQENKILKEENEKLKKLKNLYREKFISNFCANNRALKFIEDFLCTEKYIKSDPEATANNYVELLNILKSETQENLYRYTPEKGFRLVGDDND